MKNKDTGIIEKISGPLVIASGMKNAKIYEVVKVSNLSLIGEIIEIRGDKASIQVYEETSGIKPGEPVKRTGHQLSVDLAPGLIGALYDGIQRPLDLISKETGDFIERGVEVSSLDEEKKWNFIPKVSQGQNVQKGEIIGEVKESALVNHKIMIPPYIKEGEVVEIKEGSFTITDTIAVIKTKNGENKEITMHQKWPIREPRPIDEKLLPRKPLITGQRVIDTFFPIAKGGTASIPGPFGSGKTVVLHQISKWADADVIIFIGCGERGNEMTDVLTEFPELKDPKTGDPLMERTILIANTSNMPVAAREASVYTGVTLAEYFRDMGYSVALMADSTSRWAEALREMSARLEEMPGEEGYPAYLGSRIASFYERAGYVKCLSKKKREGALTIIGSVSPPGGDLSEPVTQNTLRTTKVFWALNGDLAYARHFPAIHWLDSYSLYLDNLEEFLRNEVGEDFLELRKRAIKILNKEANLEEIVRLVGYDALSEDDKLTLETAKMLKEDFLIQNAFDEIDTYTSLKKQYKILKEIISFNKKGQKMIKEGKEIEEVINLPEKKEISKLKVTPEEEI